MTDVLVYPRTHRIAAAFLTLLASSVGLGFIAAAPFIAHDSELVCAAARCVHVERYPFGIVSEAPLAPISEVRTEWDPGGRVMAVKLVLLHGDGSRSEYRGVGKNGERAGEVAVELKTFLAGGTGAHTFPLRTGSVVVAVVMASFGLVVLLLVAAFFTEVRFSRSGEGVAVVIGRWPLPRRRHARVDLAELSVRREIVNGQDFYVLHAGEIDLGLGFRSKAAAWQRVGEIQAWFARA